MMNAIELQSIISSGEGYNAEFKVSFPSKIKEVTEEICAFANAAGYANQTQYPTTRAFGFNIKATF